MHRSLLLRTLAGAMLVGGLSALADAKAPLGRVTVAGQRLTATLGSGAPLLVGAARIGAQYGIVTSGLRTVEHNRRVGGVPNSYHLLGLAIDVQRRPGISHAVIDGALRGAGFVLVESLDEGDHSHFALASRIASIRVPALPTPGVAGLKPKPAPEPSPWLADNHGVLLIDQPGSATPAAN